MTFQLFQYYLDQNFYIDNIVEKVVCAVLYICIFDFITHFLFTFLIYSFFSFVISEVK